MWSLGIPNSTLGEKIFVLTRKKETLAYLVYQKRFDIGCEKESECLQNLGTKTEDRGVNNLIQPKVEK